jgi:uncharacterized membrane protein
VTVIYLVHVFATLYMVGLIWFVQIVHYPMYDRVGEDRFAEYESNHTRLTSYAVGPAMLAEALTGIYLVIRQPEGFSALWAWVGLALIAVVWLSTSWLQVPQHNHLSRGYNPKAHRLLVQTNWLRTAAWTVRGLWVLYPLYFALNY